MPGAALTRAFRMPLTLATAFAGSAVAIYTTVVALQLVGARISLGTMAGALAAMTAAAVISSRVTPAAVFGTGAAGSTSAGSGTSRGASPPPPQHDNFESPGRFLAWLVIYALFWIAVLWRAWHEPLAGPDIEFRWSFLAEQMLRQGTLDFYPPRNAGDFQQYFWAESIPPGAAALHAWAYACAGSANASVTVPGVALQLIALHELVWRSAAALGGRRAAMYAVLAAAACPLLTWSMLLGQETGLTALSAVGIAFALLGWREHRSAGWAALAGVFAALGAAAREYGLIFPVVALLSLVWVGADRRSWGAFAIFLGLALAWPLRTLALTGNPFYSLDFAGLFPANPRFIAWIEHDAAVLGAALHTRAGWQDFGRYVFFYAPAALVGAAILLVALMRGRRDAIWPAAVSLVLAGIWAASVRFTNGGLFYSLRVLSPAVALAALVAGVGVAMLSTRRTRGAASLALALALLALATFPATLALPQNPWRTAWVHWPAFAPQVPAGGRDATLAALLDHTTKDRRNALGLVLADAPGFQRRFQAAGVTVIPLWSPQVDWLFDPKLAPADAARQWRESGVSHIIASKWQTNIDFFNAYSRWSHPPFRLQLVGDTAEAAVFAVRLVE